MVIYYQKNKEKKQEYEVDNFYKQVAKLLAEESTENSEVEVIINGVDGKVEYLVSKRSGTRFIREMENTLPDSIATGETKEVFLTCVDPEKNAYKFYKLTPMPNNEVMASYGRMGVKKGELFGERTFKYPNTMFWVKYYEKIEKGYIDRSEVYLSNKMPETKKTEKKEEKTFRNSISSVLYNKLVGYAKKTVQKAYVKVPVTEAIIQISKDIVNKMNEIAEKWVKDPAGNNLVEDFNKELLELIAILQRPVRTGDGKGVKELLAKSGYDFSSIINRERNLITAMEGSDVNSVAAGSFEDFGVEVYEATEKQKQEVMNALSDTLKSKVANIYRVIPVAQKKRFDDYMKKNNIKAIKRLWHGSRNENWASIIKNSLSLNPNAIITGKMFGDGIYFAPSSMKSWNYTSYRGTSWARGNQDTAFMGLYVTAYGTPYDVHAHSSAVNYKKETFNRKCDCLHAHKGVSLLNDEIVYYNEAAILLQYLVEFH